MAQQPAPSASTFEAVVYTAIVIALLIGLWVGWYALRRWYFSDRSDQAADVPWTLQELRDLRQQGQLTEAEYQTLRQQLIGVYRDEPDDQPPPAN